MLNMYIEQYIPVVYSHGSHYTIIKYILTALKTRGLADHGTIQDLSTYYCYCTNNKTILNIIYQLYAPTVLR